MTTIDTFIVICRGDRVPDGEPPGTYELATRSVFDTREDAERYAEGISTSREPRVVSGRFWQLRPSWTAWRYPTDEEIIDGRDKHDMIRLGQAADQASAYRLLPRDARGQRTGQLQQAGGKVESYP